ncbi:MAG: M20 family peptidase [Cytophagales bacterium]
MLKKSLLLLLLVILLVAGIVLVKTFQFTSIQTKVAAPPAPAMPETSVQHFQQAIAIKTISYGDAALFDSTQFLAFRKFLETTYPKMHSQLSREVVADYSLLYTWHGKDTTLNPIVLMAHQDVVPIEESTKSMWTVDPFAGSVKDGFIWGRGTTDDKINLIAICEAVEKLLNEGVQPLRTVYFAFGHDEEVGGRGAMATANLLKQRGIKAEMVMDEGGIITKEKVPGLAKPIALLGTAEKGYLSLELTVEIPGGHSSMPEKETAIDVLTKAIVQLRSQPFEAEFSEPLQNFFEHVGPEMPFVQRMAMANQWLFKPMIVSSYEKSGPGSAMMRTTMVPTILKAGIKDNIVPTQAKCIVNFRLLPGDLSKEVIEKVRKIVNDDRVKIEPLDNGAVAEASAVSPVDGFGYKKVEVTIKQTYPNVLTAPFLMIGATDSRHFGEVSKNIIKFSPMVDPIGFHGIDERVSLESYQTAIWFYQQLLSNLN